MINDCGLPPSETFKPRTISNADLGIPEYAVRKKPKKKTVIYKKPESVIRFEIEHQAWMYRNSPSTRSTWVYNKFSDNSANALTKIIMEWLRVHGAMGARVNTGGTWDNSRKMYIRSGSTKGAADISAIVKGRAVEIEVKYGKDKLRPDQIIYKQNTEAAGGVYLVVKNFDSFLEQINPYL